MEVSNVVDLKTLIDEMDYDCRKSDPVHYNKIINNLKNLHSLCKTEEDRELFTTYLSAAASPIVLADLGLAELQDRIEGLTEVADKVYEVREVVQEQKNENEMLRQQMDAEFVPRVTGTNKDDYEPIARVTGTNKDDYAPTSIPVEPIDEVVIPNDLAFYSEGIEETTKSR